MKSGDKWTFFLKRAGVSNALGEITFDKKNTSVVIHSDDMALMESGSDLFGETLDGIEISFIDCVISEESSTYKRGKRYYTIKLFPRVVLWGHFHIDSITQCISSVSFETDDLHKVIYDRHNFGRLHDAKWLLRQANERRKKDRFIRVGPNPRLLFFDGRMEILSAECPFGLLSICNSLSYDIPSPSGISLDNSIRCCLEFSSAKNINSALASTSDVLIFIGLLAGRIQSVHKLSIECSALPEDSKHLEMYWTTRPGRSNDDFTQSPHNDEILIQAADHVEEFRRTLGNWVSRYSDWNIARNLFSMAFSDQNNYRPERHIVAASIFELIPSSEFSEGQELDDDLHLAKMVAEKEFRTLPQSPDRDSILSALGRIGKPSLKKKVAKRADIICSKVGEHFPDLTFAANNAIDFRNQLVHGSSQKIDYMSDANIASFLTDTLEFIFAASDLIECGWDIKRWIEKTPVLFHPFGAYRAYYERNMRYLRSKLVQ